MASSINEDDSINATHKMYNHGTEINGEKINNLFMIKLMHDVWLDVGFKVEALGTTEKPLKCTNLNLM